MSIVCILWKVQVKTFTNLGFAYDFSVCYESDTPHGQPVMGYWNIMQPVATTEDIFNIS